MSSRKLQYVEEYLDAREDYKEVAGKNGRVVSAGGLGLMVEAGWKTFEEKMGVRCMPHNFVFSQMSGQLMVGPAPFKWGQRRVSEEDADRLLNEYGRMRGWLVAAATLRSVAKVIEKTQSGFGVNSPRTTLDLKRLIERFPSPGALDRRLRAVKARAAEILSAYTGQPAPSWRGIANALLHERRVGKAALVAVALDLGFVPGYQPTGAMYRQARAWLVENRERTFSVIDMTDGVMVRRQAQADLQKMGVSVFKTRRANMWIVRSGERTFHATWAWEPREALLQAITAWTEQSRLLRKERVVKDKIEGFLVGKGHESCPLFTREDSYRAGNCQPGTEAFMSSVGWGRREFIPGVDLIPHLGDERVRRVVVKRMETGA